MKKQKILYHHRTQGEGVEGVHIRGMVDGFRTIGYEIDILSPLGVDPYKKNGQNRAQKKGNGNVRSLLRIISDHLPQIGFEVLEILYNFYSLIKISRQLKKKKYLFIYERYALFSASCVLLAKWFKLPIVLEVNDATLIERSRPLILRNLARRLEKEIFRRADIIVTITGYFRNLILTIDGINPEKVIVLPNAVEPDRFQIRGGRIDRHTIDIHNKHVIGVVGAFVPWHGLEFLIEATHDLLIDLDIHVLLVGDGPVRGSVENLAVKYDVADHVTFTGFLNPSEVPYYINLMDVCLMPNSNKHCSPVKLFEYMAMGKPSVVPKYDPIEEVVSDGWEVFFFPPLDREAFRERISFLIQNEILRIQMGRRAKETVLRNHVWEKNASDLDREILKYI